MAQKLTAEAEQDLLSHILEVLGELDHPTTCNQIRKKLGLEYSDPIERITLKYNVPNVLHGAEARKLNKHLAAYDSVRTKLSKLAPKFHQLKSDGYSLIEIQEILGVGLDQFQSLCNFLDEDDTQFLIEYSDKHNVSVKGSSVVKSHRSDKVKAHKLQLRQDDWVSRCSKAAEDLRRDGIPLTLNQIAIHMNRAIIPEDMKQAIIDSIPDIITGDDANVIDDQLMRERHSESSRKATIARLETTKASNRSKYGCDWYLQTDEFKRKSEAKKFERTGDPHFTNREKAVRTLMETYGVTNVHQIPSVIQAATKTWQSRYGRSNPEGKSWLDEQIRRGTELKYGVSYPCLTQNCMNHRRVCYLYDDETFDSAWELAYYICMRDQNIDIRRYHGDGIEYTACGETHQYFPDFVVEGRFVEIKGTHFFNDEGVLYNPYTDDFQTQEIWKQKHLKMKDLDVLIVSDCTYYIRQIQKKYTANYLDLFRVGAPFPYPDKLPGKNNDKELIRYFHQSIYTGRVGDNVTPLEAWQDKSLVRRCALNRLKYVHRCKPADIVQGFNIAKIAPKVSVFSAKYATYLISRYLSDASEIFDPFSGFSGRMIGAVRNNIPYIGQDLSREHIDESNSLREYAFNDANICLIQKDILESEGCYDTLFTCPPYGLKETWGFDQVDKTCDEWIDECLTRFSCRKYLFVVDKTTKYSCNIVETKTNQSHFNSNQEIVILIDRTK